MFKVNNENTGKRYKMFKVNNKGVWCRYCIFFYYLFPPNISTVDFEQVNVC